MSDFNIKLTVRSARIIEAIEDKFGSQAEMARQTGISTSSINAFAAMRTSPVAHGVWSKSAEDLAGALGVNPSDLWPDHMRDVTLKRATAEFSLDIDAVKQVMADGRNINLALLLGKAAHGVPERRLKAIRLHVEGATLDEIGKELGVGKERARSILGQGLRKMRQKLERIGVKSVTDGVSF